MTDQLRVPYPWLVFDGTKDFVNKEPQRGEVLFCPEDSEWVRRESRALAS